MTLQKVQNKKKERSGNKRCQETDKKSGKIGDYTG